MTSDPTLPALDPVAAGPGVPAGRAERISGGQAGMVLASSVLGALSSVVVMLIASRSLGPVANADFLLFWSLMQGVFSVLVGVQNEAARGVALAGRSPSGRGARTLAVSATAGVASAVLLLALGPLISGRVLGHHGWTAVAILAGAAVLYALHIGTVGSLAGIRAWTAYAGVLSTEVIARVLLVLAVAAVSVSLLGMQLASAAAVAAPLLWLLVSADVREAFRARTDVPYRRALRNVLLAASSTACTALILTAFPLVLALARPGLDAALLGALILTIQLTRAPIMMPLTSFQAVAISAFTRHREDPLRAVARPAASLLGLGLVGATAAYVVGPWFLPLFSPAYDMVPGWAFSVLVISGALIGVLTLLGAMSLSADRHVLYVAGWLSATLLAVGILLLPLGAVAGTALALTAGPAGGCAVILQGIRGGAATRSRR